MSFPKIVLMMALGASLAGTGARAQEPPRPDTAAPRGDESSSLGQPAAQPLRAGDWLAPPSRMHWGPFRLSSAQVLGAYSNRPLAGNPQQVSELPRFLGNQAEGLFQSSATFGFFQRWGRGSLGAQYTPSLFRQGSVGLTRLNHNLAVNYYREFGRDWQIDFSARGGTYNQYGVLLQQPFLEPIVRLQTPLTNQDLLNIVDPPQALKEPVTDYLLTGRQLLGSNFGLTLKRRLSPRDSLIFSTVHSVNRSLEAETEPGLLLPDFHSNGRSLSAGFEHAFSSRSQVGVVYADKHMTSRHGDGAQQQVEITYNWLPAPRWSMHLAAGPALRDEGLGVRKPQAAANAYLIRTAASWMMSFSFDRDFYFAGLPGGRESQRMEFTWASRLRGHKWLYSVSSGYQWLSAGAERGTEASGFLLRPAIAVPLTSSLQTIAQYVFFDQQWGRGVPVQGLTNFQRHMVLFGVRWTFDVDSRLP